MTNIGSPQFLWTVEEIRAHGELVCKLKGWYSQGRRKFRDIAQVAGLVFNGYPGKNKKASHIQASSQLFFDVFNDYDPNNLLLRQSYDEVTDFQFEEQRLREALDRISKQEIVVTNPTKFTPLSFPIIVDRTRETVTSEKLSDRIKKLSVQ